MQWKLDLIDQINAGLKSEPVKYSKNDKKNYQRVTVEGKFKYNKQIYLYSLNETGKPGFDVITPLMTNSNEHVLVNRGWIEKNYKDLKSINVIKDNEIVGIFREIPKNQTFLSQKTIFSKNVWFSLDVNDLKRFTGINFRNYVIFLEGKKTNLPAPKVITANLTNNHLKYALTWYSVALSILIYFLYFRKKQ